MKRLIRWVRRDAEQVLPVKAVSIVRWPAGRPVANQVRVRTW